MGYTVRIIRPAGDEISLSEWRSLVDADPEMQHKSLAQVETSGGLVRYEGSGLAKWKGTWFDYRRGAIFVKRPNAEEIAKMKQIANSLDAKVIGDEGEEY